MPDLLRLGLDQPTGLGAAMSGAKGRLATTARRPRDFYPTPPEATRALLLAESDAIRVHGRRVWEPCGHGGAIAAVLASDGFLTAATDIEPDPEHGVLPLDLLAARDRRAPIVVTNPPFGLAPRMIAHLLGPLRVRYCALLLKTTFWCTDSETGRGRLGLFRAHPPARRWDMTWRVDFTGGNNSTMNVSWFVWDSNAAGAPMTWGLLGRAGPIWTDDLLATLDTDSPPG